MDYPYIVFVCKFAVCRIFVYIAISGITWPSSNHIVRTDINVSGNGLTAMPQGYQQVDLLNFLFHFLFLYLY